MESALSTSKPQRSITPALSGLMEPMDQPDPSAPKGSTRVLVELAVAAEVAAEVEQDPADQFMSKLQISRPVQLLPPEVQEEPQIPAVEEAIAPAVWREAVVVVEEVDQPAEPPALTLVAVAPEPLPQVPQPPPPAVPAATVSSAAI